MGSLAADVGPGDAAKLAGQGRRPAFRKEPTYELQESNLRPIGLEHNSS
jgi:hypothetical protein